MRFPTLKQGGKRSATLPLHSLHPRDTAPLSKQCGAVAEWSKALAWKVSIRQKRIQGSNPCRSASHIFIFCKCYLMWSAPPDKIRLPL